MLILDQEREQESFKITNVKTVIKFHMLLEKTSLAYGPMPWHMKLQWWVNTINAEQEDILKTATVTAHVECVHAGIKYMYRIS